MAVDAFIIIAVTAAALVPFLSSSMCVLCRISSMHRPRVDEVGMNIPLKSALPEKAVRIPMLFSGATIDAA